MSRIFDVVQTMSGQGNCIVIPCPYLDFFTGDQQAHVLAAILNQLVFWSGKSSQGDGWFYKSHEELAGEIRGVTKDQIRRAVSKLVHEYLPGIIEVATRKVNGTPVKHYRLDGDALIAKIFSPLLETAESPHGNGESVVSKRQDRPMETAGSPLPGNGDSPTSYLYPDQYTDNNKQIIKPSLSKNSDEFSDADENSPPLPDDEIRTPAGKYRGTADDLKAARWMYEKILTVNNTFREPNWPAWANDIRLMREKDGRTHREICALFAWANRDPFWCANILCPSKLRTKWDELVIKSRQVLLKSQRSELDWDGTDWADGLRAEGIL